MDLLGGPRTSLEPRTKNQDCTESLGGILVLGSWYWGGPRTSWEVLGGPRTSWEVLGPHWNQEPRTKIAQKVLGESWFLVLGTGEVLGPPGPHWNQEPRTKIAQKVLGESWFLVLGTGEVLGPLSSSSLQTMS